MMKCFITYHMMLERIFAVSSRLAPVRFRSDNIAYLLIVQQVNITNTEYSKLCTYQHQYYYVAHVAGLFKEHLNTHCCNSFLGAAGRNNSVSLICFGLLCIIIFYVCIDRTVHSTTGT